jgi:hypothetical protein
MAQQYNYKRFNHFRNYLAQHQVGLTDEARAFMFHDFQSMLDRFDAIRGERRNFLSYEFVMGKLAERHGMSGVQVRPLRIPANFLEHERIWTMLAAALRPSPHQKRMAAIKIRSRWRMMVAKRRRERLLIGREIELLPDIGIEFLRAQRRFQKGA